ncbi:MAG: TetR/AcrR family transcriptional regulator, partial [Bacteroidota bacterium]
MKESKTAISDMEIGTEEKIKLAALRLFTQKGFNDTKTRDIAEEAGINVASLHYYFRSKDKLFQLVAEEAMQGFSTIRERIFSNKQPLHIKIREFVEQYIDFFRDNPFLPLFIVTESEKNSEKMLDMMSNSEAHREIQVHLDNLSKEGIIRPMSLFNFISNLVGMTIFP